MASSRPTNLDGITHRRRPTPAVQPSPALPQKRTGFKKARGFGLWLTVIACFYLIGAPFAPSLVGPPAIPVAQSRTEPTPLTGVDMPSPAPAPIPGPNTLTIPQIGVDTEIVEGATEDALLKGAWRRPNSSTPDKGGNTVIAAHRFMYLSGPKTFYYLDKIKESDVFSLVWQGKKYEYKVYSVNEVSSKQVDIENPTEEPIVTLYTCTPLWTSEKRLVVRAHLLE